MALQAACRNSPPLATPVHQEEPAAAGLQDAGYNQEDIAGCLRGERRESAL